MFASGSWMCIRRMRPSDIFLIQFAVYPFVWLGHSVVVGRDGVVVAVVVVVVAIVVSLVLVLALALVPSGTRFCAPAPASLAV